MDDAELERLLMDLSCSEDCRRLVHECRSKSPVRDVRPSLSNSVVYLFSRKNGNRHMKVESRTVEAPAGTLYEHDPTCFEWYTQPLEMDVQIRDHDGKVVTRTRHYPDFLLIKSDGIELQEWREESRLQESDNHGFELPRRKVRSRQNVPSLQRRREALESALKTDVPPSLTSVGRELGLNPKTLTREHPDLAAKLVRRSKQYRASQRKLRWDCAKVEFERCVALLGKRGLRVTWRNLSPIIRDRRLTWSRMIDLMRAYRQALPPSSHR
jgi:hypothetical protein